MKDSSLPEHFPPREILILGAGRFGYIAAQRLSRRYPESAFLVVDANEEKLRKIHDDLGVPVRSGDALSFIADDAIADALWIIPAVPVHVGFLWLLNELKSAGQAFALSVPEAVDQQVPNPYRVPSGTVYTSFATFLCPDVCNEPDEVCTHTGKPRPGNLFDRIGEVEVPGYNVVVIRSWQLAPGVGGYTAGYLRAVRDRVAHKPGAYLVATSCRCHGVIDSLQWNEMGDIQTSG